MEEKKNAWGRISNIPINEKYMLSIREASDYVLVHFEAPYDQSESVKVKRTGYGSVYYSRYGQTPTE